MSNNLVCPYCNAQVEMKGRSTDWIECECGGIFSPEEGRPVSEKKWVVVEKERKEDELRAREKKRKEEEQLRLEQIWSEREKKRRNDENIEWLKNNDVNALFFGNLLNKIIAQNEELIELNKTQIALLSKMAMKSNESSQSYQAPAAHTYGPDEYLRDKMIYEKEGKHSVEGYAAYVRARDYEFRR